MDDERLHYARVNMWLALMVAGWRLIPGHDYAREDWAVLLMQTDKETSPAELRRLCAVFTLETRSNRSRGSTSRNVVLRSKRYARAA